MVLKHLISSNATKFAAWGEGLGLKYLGLGRVGLSCRVQFISVQGGCRWRFILWNRRSAGAGYNYLFYNIQFVLGGGAFKLGH